MGGKEKKEMKGRGGKGRIGKEKGRKGKEKERKGRKGI